MPKGVYPRAPRPRTPKRIRTLQAGEPRPDGEPRRYADRQGYVRLRWKVGVQDYVEIREHRAVDGASPGTHVHHRNLRRDDNRPGNLVSLTPEEHAAVHSQERRRFDRARAAQLYAAGLSTTDVARIYGVNAATVSRGLRAEGIPMRPFGATPRVFVDQDAVVRLHEAGMRANRIGEKLGVGREVIVRVLRDHGCKPHPVGRPPSN